LAAKRTGPKWERIVRAVKRDLGTVWVRKGGREWVGDGDGVSAGKQSSEQVKDLPPRYRKNSDCDYKFRSIRTKTGRHVEMVTRRCGMSG
jgi:hypothetical protein